MHRLSQATLALVVSLTAVAALAVPIWYWDGGLIEIEATQFVRQYLDNRSVLQKVFDPHGNDLGTYQARELSYFVDYLDARVFEALMVADRRLFVPASALAASALTLVVSFVAIWRFPAAARLPAALLLLVYVTNYVHVVTMGMLYRSSKPLLAPVLLATVFYLLGILRPPLAGSATARSGRGAALVVFVLFSIMSLLDRQGFFYACAGSGALAIHLALFGGRRDVLAGGAAAVGVVVLYNLVLGPLLVEGINRYSPSFAYQRLPWQNLFLDPRMVLHAGALVCQSVATLMGGAPPWMLGLAVSAGAIGMLFRRRVAIVLACVVVALGQIVLVALMIARHPPIYHYYDHRVWYYPLPFQALLVALLIAATGRFVPAWRGARTAGLSILLAALAAGNVAHWDDYRRAQLRSHWFPEVYGQNVALKASFADGRPRPLLSPEFGAFFEFWRSRAPALRARAQQAQDGPR